MPFQPIIIAVRENSQVFEARRSALGLAEALSWGETLCGKVAVVVTEIATNLVKHAAGGEVHIQQCERGGVTGIEVLAIDRGPGIGSTEKSLEDGFSTAGTAGTGLGAIRRLSNEFDLYSRPGQGTVIVARLYPESGAAEAKAPANRFIIGAVRAPLRGESVSGDNWALRTAQNGPVVLVADGLGHGYGAAQASEEAVNVLHRATSLEPVSVLQTVHGALRATRGAAVAVASIDVAADRLTFAGVGNVSAMIFKGSTLQHLVSHNGTAGQAVRKFQDFAYLWPQGGTLLMHSDGITTSWRLDSYPGLAERHPSLVAAVLYRDASRGRDDACVVVLRQVDLY